MSQFSTHVRRFFSLCFSFIIFFSFISFQRQHTHAGERCQAENVPLHVQTHIRCKIKTKNINSNNDGKQDNSSVFDLTYMHCAFSIKCTFYPTPMTARYLARESRAQMTWIYIINRFFSQEKPSRVTMQS